MKKIWTILSVLLLAGVMVSCDSDKDDNVINDEPRAVNMLFPPQRIELTDAQRAYVGANNEFALNLFRHLCEASGTKSLFCSPLSVTYVLGMINSGAEGETQQEIQDVLAFGTDDPAAINAYCQNLIKNAPNLDPKVTLTIANSLFMNKNMAHVDDAYKAEMVKWYEAELSDLDFSDPNNVDVINQWAKEKTQGLIPTILSRDEFSASALLYLLNAIYFKADWAEKFEEKYTEKATFHSPSGNTTVDMMHQKVIVSYADMGDYTMIALPYGSGAFRMLLLLPKEGKDLDQVLANLKPTDLAEAHFASAEVDVKVPRWTTDSDMDLKKILWNMGIRRMFDPQEAQLTKMVKEGSPYVSMIKQKAAVEVNESGSKMAAVTVGGIEMLSAAPMPQTLGTKEFHADRPFAYLVTERTTNVLFFMGRNMGN